MSLQGTSGESRIPQNLPGTAATKVIFGTGEGPGPECGLGRQSLSTIPCKAGRHSVSDVGQKQSHSSGDFDRYEGVAGRVGPAKSSEIKSPGQGMSDHNDSGVMGSGRVVCAQGQGVSECSVQSEATDSTGLRVSPPLWPYLTVSRNTLPLSNGRPTRGWN